MTTSLNKDLRAKIVDNVVNATNIPELEKSIRQRTKQRGREYVIAGLPEDFIEKTKDLLDCKTVEQVLERMPELESHIPKASKPMPLVAASNLLSSLTQLGFDRTKQAA